MKKKFVCSWCHPHYVLPAGMKQEDISHGICDIHKAQVRAQIRGTLPKLPPNPRVDLTAKTEYNAHLLPKKAD